MADLIANYIKNSISIKEKPILSNFIKWVSEHNNSKEVQETFPLAIGVDKEINIEEKSNSAKEELFFDAIKATYDKYGIKQIIGAIKALINNNDYGMFTNGEEYYRVKMQKFITRDDAMQYIKKTLKLNSNDISDKEIVLFCYKVFGNDLYKIIYNSCMTTFYKYGENQVKNALKNVHYLSSYNGFTRFSPSGDDHTNYRDLIAKIPNDVVIDIIKLLMGIPLYSDIAYSVDQIITYFINGYIATKHISEEMNNSMSK